MDEEKPKQPERRRGFVDVTDAEGRLLFLFDPERDLIEIKPRGRPGIVVVDLRSFRQEASGYCTLVIDEGR